MSVFSVNSVFGPSSTKFTYLHVRFCARLTLRPGSHREFADSVKRQEKVFFDPNCASSKTVLEYRVIIRLLSNNNCDRS
jgi:hypothetical protein